MSAQPDSLPTQGSLFLSFAQAELAITRFSVYHAFCPGVLHSDKQRMVWNCQSSKSCPWQARVHKGKNPLVKLTRLNDNSVHNCAGNCNPIRHPASSHQYLVKTIPEHMSLGPKTTAKDIFGVLNHSLGIAPSLSSIYKAKTALLNGLDDKLLLQVQQIPAYLELLKQRDQDAIVHLDLNDNLGPSQFDQCFIAPSATRAAFTHLWPVLSLDGTFLKNKVKLMLLLAAAFDANDSPVIVAWAIVQQESIGNWTWFIANLVEAYPSIQQPGYTVISDHDKGLLHAMQTQLLLANHAYCCYHLAANMKSRFGQAAARYMWHLIYAPTVFQFNDALQDLQRQSPAAADYLCTPEQAHFHWATYCFPGRQFGLVTSNLAEIANSLLVSIRMLPLVDLLAAIWEHQMHRFYERSKQAEEWTGLLSWEANQALQNKAQAARTLCSIPSSSFEGVVRGESVSARLEACRHPTQKGELGRLPAGRTALSGGRLLSDR